MITYSFAGSIIIVIVFTHPFLSL
jgi:hypothetical protein